MGLAHVLASVFWLLLLSWLLFLHMLSALACVFGHCLPLLPLMCLFVFLSACLSLRLSVCPSVGLTVRLSVLAVYLSVLCALLVPLVSMSVCLCVRPVICLFHSASLLVFLCCLLATFGLDPSCVSSAMPRRDQRLRKGSRHRKNLDGRRVCRSFAAQQATFDLLCCCSRSVPSTYSSPARPPIEAFRGV